MASAARDAVFKYSPDYIFVLDREGRVQLAVNPPFGLNAAEMVGRTAREILPPGVADRLEALRDEARTTRRAVRATLPVAGSGGATRWLHGVLEARFDDAGAYQGTVGFVRDVTEQQRTEAALRDRDALLREITDLTPDTIFVQDRQLRFEAIINPRFGNAPEAILGRTDAEALPGWFVDLVAPWKREVLETGLPKDVAFDTPDGAGGTRRMEGVFVPRRDAAGQVSGLIGYLRDATERRRAEEEMRRVRDVLVEAQRIAHVGSFEYDAATRRTTWSEEQFRIYGRDPSGPSPEYAEMLARCIHPDDAALLHATFGAALQNLSVYELEHRIVRPDGSVRWVYDLAHPFCDANGKLVRDVGTTLDITERKRAAEELARQQAAYVAAVGRIAGGVAHELNNALQAIGLNVGMAREDAILPELRESLDAATQAIEDSADFIAKLLDLSGQGWSQPQRLDADAAIADCLPECRRLAGAGITWEVVSGAAGAAVRIDPSHLTKVLVSLVDNAREAVDGPGRIRIETANIELDAIFCAAHEKLQPGPHVRIAVSDTGRGIAPDVLARVFDPFYTTKPFGERPGLGLPVVRGLVHQAGGGIDIASELGQGTTVTIWLPRTR